MSPLDTKILGLLIKDGRASFAEIARALKVSRAHVRDLWERNEVLAEKLELNKQ